MELPMTVRTDEIANGIFRLSTLVPEVAAPAGGFTFNQYLIRAEQPLLFHTGPPRMLADGETLDLGGKRVRWIDTPHVPHAWESGLIYEETTGTLMTGDLFTAAGDGPALTRESIVTAAAQTEEMFKASSLTPQLAPTIRRLAALQPKALAVMHGSCFAGDCAGELNGL